MRILSFLLLSAIIFLSACGGDNKTPNGYAYTKHTQSTGKKAVAGDYAFLHIYVYTDGVLMNTTRERGEPMAIKVPSQEEVKSEGDKVGKINPISDVLAVMSVGDSVSLIVPIDSSMRAAPQLKDVKELKYAIVMENLKTQEEYDAYQEERRNALNKDREAAVAMEATIATQMTDIATKYKNGELKSQLKSTPSGLKYMIVEAGTGQEIEPTDQVTVHYYGTLTDGTMFDNSYKRGQPYPVKLGMGQVIKGWDEGIPMLKGGDKAVLFIPSDLAYGNQANGQIPANAELLFYVDVVKVGI